MVTIQKFVKQCSSHVYSPALRITIGWFGLILLGIIIYGISIPRLGMPITSQSKVPFGVIFGQHSSANEQLLISSEGYVHVIAWDEVNPQLVANRFLDGTINDLAINRSNNDIGIGGSTREVFLYNRQLEELLRIPVRGQITGVDITDDGNILATYGIGQFSERYFVGKFSNEDGSVLYEVGVGFTTRGVVSLGDVAYFGTADSRVGAISPSGEILWRTTIRRAVTSMNAAKSLQSILVGDEQGGVYLLDSEGVVTWNTKVSNFPITAISIVEDTNYIIVGDLNGTLIVLDADGNQLFRRQVFAVEERISAIVVSSESNTVYAYSRRGNVSIVHTSVLHDTIRRERITFIGNIFLIFAIVGTLVIGINQFTISRKKAIWVGSQLKRSRLAYILLLPSFLTLLVFSYYPIATAVYYSLTNFSLARPLRFTGFENYIKLLDDPYFWGGMGNLLRILITKIIKDVTIPLLVAELIFWLRNSKHQYLFRTAFVIPSIVPGVVMVLLWRMIYDPSVGIINKLLFSMGLGQYATAWLGNEATAIWAIIFAGFPWIGVFSFLVYFGGLINISRDIYDAAVIEGVGVVHRFFRIDVPMLRPQFRLILFFSYVGSIQTFADIWIYTRGGPGNATYVPGLQMFLKISEGEYGYASAIGMVLFLMAFLGTVMNFRFGKKVDE